MFSVILETVCLVGDCRRECLGLCAMCLHCSPHLTSFRKINTQHNTVHLLFFKSSCWVLTISSNMWLNRKDSSVTVSLEFTMVAKKVKLIARRRHQDSSVYRQLVNESKDKTAVSREYPQVDSSCPEPGLE